MTTNQCTCQNFFFGTYGEDGSAESYEDYGTGCTQTTGRTFAQGHDAKLVGFMVRAELNGEEIAQVDGGMRVTFPGAVAAAASISPALGDKADAMMKAAIARLAKKTAKPRVTKTPKQAMNDLVERQAAAELAKPVQRQAKIKVGRWTYDATIFPNGTAAYVTKTGALKNAPAGTWTEIN